MNALGFGIGSVVWAVAAIFGLSVLFAIVPWLYLIVKVCGALYLIYLAYKLLRSNGLQELQVGEKKISNSMMASLHKGFLIQLSNPKVVIFMGSILATLLPKDATPELLTAVVVVIFLNEFLWYSLVASVFSVGKLRNAYAKVSKIVDRTTGLLLGGLGVRILVST